MVESIMDCVWLSVKDMKPSSRSRFACLRPFRISPQKRVSLSNGCCDDKECFEGKKEVGIHCKYSENICKENKTKRMKIKLRGSGKKMSTKNDGKVMKRGRMALKKFIQKELSSKDAEVKSQGSYFGVHKEIEMEKKVNFQGIILHASEETEMKGNDKLQEIEDVLTKEFEMKERIQTQETADITLKEMEMEIVGIQKENDESNSLESKIKGIGTEQDGIEVKEEKLVNNAKGVLKGNSECYKKQKKSEDSMLIENYIKEIEMKPQEGRESQLKEGHVKDQGKELEMCEELIRPEVSKEWALPRPFVKHCDIAAEDNTILHVHSRMRERDGTDGNPLVVSHLMQHAPVFPKGWLECDVKFSCRESPRIHGLFSKKWEDKIGIICSDSSVENIADLYGGADDMENDTGKHQQKFSNFNPSKRERTIEYEVALSKPIKKELVLSETTVGSFITKSTGGIGDCSERKEIITENTNTNIVVKSNCITGVTFKDHKKLKSKQGHFDPNKNEQKCSSVYTNDQVLLTKVDVHMETVELRKNVTEIRVSDRNMFVSHNDSMEDSSRSHSDDYMKCTDTHPTIVMRENDSLKVFRVPKDIPQNKSADEHESEYCITDGKSPSEILPGVFTDERFPSKCNMSSLERIIPRSHSRENMGYFTVGKEGDIEHLTDGRNFHSGQVPVREVDPDRVPLEIQCYFDNVHMRDKGDSGHVILKKERDQDSICMKKECEYNHLPLEKKGDHDRIPVGREAEHCHLSLERDADHLVVRREGYPNSSQMKGESELEKILSRRIVDPNVISFRSEGGSDHEYMNQENKSNHVCVSKVDSNFVCVGRESDLDHSPLKRKSDLNHVLGGKKDYNSAFIGMDFGQENQLEGGSCDHEGLPCIKNVNTYESVEERMHDNRFSCNTYPSVCVREGPTGERSKVLEHHESQEKLDSDRDIKTKDRDKLDIAGKLSNVPLKGQENEIVVEDFCEKNCGLEKSSSYVLPTEREEGQAAGEDVINCYNLGHLISLLQVSGALSDSKHLLSIPRSYLTVELVMAAINANIFKNSDIFTWICRICRPKSKRYTSKFAHQFQQYQQLYQHITEKVCPDKRDVWGNLLKQSVYRIPKGKGLCLIFGKIPELCKNEALDISLIGHLDGVIQKDMALAPFEYQRGYDGCRESIKAMRGEIDRLLSELKGKNEELKHQQEYTKQEMKKIREGDSGKQELMSIYETLIEEIRLSFLLIEIQSSTVNHDIVEEEKGAYLRQVPKVLACLRQIILEKESKVNQLQDKVNSYLDMVKAREIIIKQQQEEICKNEREATQTDVYIKQLKKHVKVAESRVKDCESHIHQQEELLRMKSVSPNYVKQLEEDITKLRGILREQELLICQQQEKHTQMENAIIVCESLNKQLNQELKVVQHTLHERDAQIQCHQTLHSQLEYDAQQKEAIAQRLKEELHACEVTLSEKEAHISALHAERSVRITELEERLVCCNNLLVERNDIIEKLKIDLAVLEKKEKEKDTQIHNLEEEVNHYQNYVMEIHAVSFNDSSSVSDRFNNNQIRKKFNDTEYSQSYPKGRATNKKTSDGDVIYKPTLDHLLMLKKKDEQHRRDTDKLKEIEQVLYLSKQERDGSPATDLKSVQELRTLVSELKRCIVSREEMNGQLEEMLRNQEQSIEKLKNHQEAKDSIINYLQMLCVNSNSVLKSFQEDSLSLDKSVDKKTEWFNDLKVGPSFAIQDSSQEVSLQHIENMKLEPINDSSMLVKEYLGQAEELEISHSRQIRQKPSIVHSCFTKENTTITVGDVGIPNSILVQETSSSKRVVSKESHHLKITLSEYRVRSKGKEVDLNEEKQKLHLPCTFSNQKQNMKRKGNEVGLPETSLSMTMKNPHPEKRRRILSRENFPAELNKKKSTKSQIIGREDLDHIGKDCYTIPSVGQTGMRQEKHKYLKHRSKRHDYQTHQSHREKNPGEEMLRLKKTLEYIKGKHDKAMAKEIEERLKLEERSRSREILLAQLVKDCGKLEVQLRNSDTALTIIENDRGRISTLLEHVETDLKQALNTKEYLRGLIRQKDDALKVCHDEKAELNLIIKQKIEEHQKKVEVLRHALSDKEMNVSGLKKEMENLEEDIKKERENHHKVTEQMEKDLRSRTSALEVMRNEKDQLIKDVEKKDINLKIHIEDKEQLAAMLKIEKDINDQFGKKLMENEKKLRDSVEGKIEVERLLKGKEQALVRLEEKTKYMEATIEEKTKEMLLLQEEICNLKRSREKEDAVKETVVLEKQKLQNTLKQLEQALREQLEDKKQKEAIIQKLQGTIISETEKTQMVNKKASEALAHKEQEIHGLQKDKDQLEVDIEENKQKHSIILSEKDRYLKMQLDLVHNDLEEALKANATLKGQLEDIKATKILIRKELKLGAASCKPLNLKQEFESVCKLTNILKEEKMRSGVMNRELLDEKSRNRTLMKQLQMIKDKKFLKRWANKGKQNLLNQECQTLPLQEEDLQFHIENTKNLKTALETEKRVSEGMYLKLLVEQKKSMSLATGLQQAYEETSKDLEYQLSLFCWAAEKYREKLRKLEELTAISTNSEVGVEEFPP